MTDITSEQIRSTSDNEFTSSEYGQVAKLAELAAINLIKVKSDFVPGGMIDDKIKLSFGRKVVSCGFDKEESVAHAVFQYFVKGKRSGKSVFNISADYAVLYFCSGDVAPNAAKAFAHNVGVFAAYAYFRALASHLAWSANLELPPLPMIASQAFKPQD